MRPLHIIWMIGKKWIFDEYSYLCKGLYIENLLRGSNLRSEFK